MAPESEENLDVQIDDNDVQIDDSTIEVDDDITTEEIDEQIEKKGNIFDQMGKSTFFKKSKEKREKQVMSAERKSQILKSWFNVSKILLAIVSIAFIALLFDGIAKSSDQDGILLRLPIFSKGSFFCNRVNDGLDADISTEDIAEARKVSKVGGGYSVVPGGGQDSILPQNFRDTGCLTKENINEIYAYKQWKTEKEIRQKIERSLLDRIEYESFETSPLVRFIYQKRPAVRLNNGAFIEEILEIVDQIDAEPNKSLRCNRLDFDDFSARIGCSALSGSGESSRKVALEFFDAISGHEDFLTYDYPTGLNSSIVENEGEGTGLLGMDPIITQTSLEVEIIYSPTNYEAELGNK